MLKTLPEEVEAYRDRAWRREPEARVETAVEAEKLVESAGFCATMTDSRRPGPSLYIAVCGRATRTCRATYRKTRRAA